MCLKWDLNATVKFTTSQSLTRSYGNKIYEYKFEEWTSNQNVISNKYCSLIEWFGSASVKLMLECFYDGKARTDQPLTRPDHFFYLTSNFVIKNSIDQLLVILNWKTYTYN